MTTYINNTTKSTPKEIIAAAKANGYTFNKVKGICPMSCGNGKYSALKLTKSKERTVIYACPCGYRSKIVEDGNISVIDKRGGVPQAQAMGHAPAAITVPANTCTRCGKNEAPKGRKLCTTCYPARGARQSVIM